MKTNIKDYIKHYKGVISSELCNQTIVELQTAEYQQHQFYNSKDDIVRPRSGAQELDITNTEIPSKNKFMDALWPILKKHVDDLDMPWFSGWSGYSRIRFNRYKENRKMALHADHIQSIFDGEKKGIPILSILGVLNDDYEGGEFYLIDDIIDLKKGDVIIFPSNFMYPHKVEPVTKGTRYSYISWVW